MSNFINISTARNNLPKLVDQVADGYESITITVNGKPKAVLINAAELDSIMETIGILEQPGVRKDLKEGLKQAKNSQGIPLSQLK